MKIIMLIVVATLTIATSNATNWGTIHNLQIVNNTSVELEFRTMSDNTYFTLNAGESRSAPDIRTGSMYVGWGVDDTGNGKIIRTQSFDDSQQTGNLPATTVSITGFMGIGEAWALGNVSYNDVLVFTSIVDQAGMALTATRTRGVVVYRGWDSNGDWADVFCLDSNIEFGLLYDGDSGRCPVGETRVVMGDNITISHGSNNINSWDVLRLNSNIKYFCTYDNDVCKVNPNYNATYADSIIGEYIDEFESVPYSSSRSQLNLWI